MPSTCRVLRAASRAFVFHRGVTVSSGSQRLSRTVALLANSGQGSVTRPRRSLPSSSNTPWSSSPWWLGAVPVPMSTPCSRCGGTGFVCTWPCVSCTDSTSWLCTPIFTYASSDVRVMEVTRSAARAAGAGRARPCGPRVRQTSYLVRRPRDRLGGPRPDADLRSRRSARPVRRRSAGAPCRGGCPAPGRWRPGRGSEPARRRGRRRGS